MCPYWYSIKMWRVKGTIKLRGHVIKQRDQQDML